MTRYKKITFCDDYDDKKWNVSADFLKAKSESCRMHSREESRGGNVRRM